ncbi:hypothetical protein V1512DRAFT_258587 [Lipomyces arxii]|uniref:uncharacterized protein n=1 Tax=Lipomyces arxii TaxID=56418 RepID=UPI0034CE9AB4
MTSPTTNTRTSQGKAHRSRRHSSARDPIDRLDLSFGSGREYHHEGPFDAAAPYRNGGPNAPLAALATTNDLSGVVSPAPTHTYDEFMDPRIIKVDPSQDFATAPANATNENERRRSSSISRRHSLSPRRRQPVITRTDSSIPLLAQQTRDSDNQAVLTEADIAQDREVWKTLHSSTEIGATL